MMTALIERDFKMIKLSDTETYNYGDVVIFVSLDTRKAVAKVTSECVKYYVNKSNFDKSLVARIEQVKQEIKNDKR